MKRKPLVLAAVCACLLAGAAALAQPPKMVAVHITGAGNGRTINVTPVADHACVNAKANCPNQVQWTATGQLQTGERILVAFSDGTAGADQCMDQTTYAITSSPGQVSGTIQNCLTAGKKKAAWLYDVCCVKDSAATDCKTASQICDGVAVVDPGMVIGD